MPACRVDNKPSDTLVAGLRLKVLDGEFDSPPSPPILAETMDQAQPSRGVAAITGLVIFFEAIPIGTLTGSRIRSLDQLAQNA